MVDSQLLVAAQRIEEFLLYKRDRHAMLMRLRKERGTHEYADQGSHNVSEQVIETQVNKNHELATIENLRQTVLTNLASSEQSEKKSDPCKENVSLALHHKNDNDMATIITQEQALGESSSSLKTLVD